jgi:hypothetical protein
MTYHTISSSPVEWETARYTCLRTFLPTLSWEKGSPRCQQGMYKANPVILLTYTKTVSRPYSCVGLGHYRNTLSLIIWLNTDWFDYLYDVILQNSQVETFCCTILFTDIALFVQMIFDLIKFTRGVGGAGSSIIQDDLIVHAWEIRLDHFAISLSTIGEVSRNYWNVGLGNPVSWVFLWVQAM